MVAKERIDPFSEQDLLVKSYHFRRYQLAKDYVSAQKGYLILDVGCGTGFGMRFLKNGVEVVGTDYSVEAVHYGKKHYKCEKCSFIVSDGHFLPFKNSVFDCVVCLEVIEHVKRPPMLMQEIYRVLKERSNIILSTPNTEKPTGNPFHVKEFSLRELCDFINFFGFKTEVRKEVLIKDGYRIYYLLSKLLGKINRLLYVPKIIHTLRYWLAEFLVRITISFPKYSYFVFLVASKGNATILDQKGV